MMTINRMHLTKKEQDMLHYMLNRKGMKEITGLDLKLDDDGYYMYDNNCNVELAWNYAVVNITFTFLALKCSFKNKVQAEAWAEFCDPLYSREYAHSFFEG